MSTLSSLVSELGGELREFIETERTRVTRERDFLRGLSARSSVVDSAANQLVELYLSGSLASSLPITNDL